MTIHIRMKTRTEREKDLVKYGRRQERERIIKLLEDECSSDWPKVIEMPLSNLIELIEGEEK